MNRSLWAMLLIAVAGFVFLGVLGMHYLGQAAGVEDHLALKEQLELRHEPVEAVVAIDRTYSGAGQAIVVRLVFAADGLPFEDDAGRDEFVAGVGRHVWRSFPSSRARPLERVTVVVEAVDGSGCSGPRRIVRAEVPDERTPAPAGRGGVDRGG